MTLKAQLDEVSKSFAANDDIPADLKQTMAGFGTELASWELEKSALNAGQAMKDFALVSAGAREVRLTEELAKGPAVVMFYRGKW